MGQGPLDLCFQGTLICPRLWAVGSKLQGVCLCLVCDGSSVFLNILQENLGVWGSLDICQGQGQPLLSFIGQGFART